jgi:hypothetical protein
MRAAPPARAAVVTRFGVDPLLSTLRSRENESEG